MTVSLMRLPQLMCVTAVVKADTVECEFNCVNVLRSTPERSNRHAGEHWHAKRRLDGNVNTLLLSIIVTSKSWKSHRGFGTSMTNAAMVIMWPNSDGTITLSQRRAPAYSLPIVDRNPPRVANVLAASSDVCILTF